MNVAPPKATLWTSCRELTLAPTVITAAAEPGVAIEFSAGKRCSPRAPALPAAAAHLIEHYIEGSVADLRPATLVLPGRRARRRLIELLLDAAEFRGATLIPPKATTVGHLPELLHSGAQPLADDVISRRAWSWALRNVNRRVLEKVFPRLPVSDGPTEWDELAGLLAGLHENLAREGHRFADVVKMCRSGFLFDDGTRWDVLAQVQGLYLQSLERAGVADRFEARARALESGIATRAGDLWLVSIVELPGSGPCARATPLYPVRQKQVKKKKSFRKRGDMTIFRMK